MKNSLWAVIVVVVAFLGFLIGYSVSSYTGIHKIQGGYPADAEAGGYGGKSAGYGQESAGYGQAAGDASQKSTTSVENREESEDYGERTGFYGADE